MNRLASLYMVTRVREQAGLRRERKNKKKEFENRRGRILEPSAHMLGG